MAQIQFLSSLDAPELAPYRNMRAQPDTRVEGIFVAEGEKVVRRLLESRLEVVSLMLPEKWLGRYSELIASRKRVNKQLDEELEFVENDPENRRCVYVLMSGTVDDPVIKYDKKGLKQKVGEDIRAEKQNLKQILKEEFGLFKKDSALVKNDQPKGEQRFKIGFDDGKEKKKPNDLKPKKKEEDDDF